MLDFEDILVSFLEKFVLFLCGILVVAFLAFMGWIGFSLIP